MPSRNERDSQRLARLELLRQALSEVRLGDALALLRAQMGDSQNAMASRLGWEQSTLARAEQGQRRTIYDIRTLLHVVDTLGLSREILLPILIPTAKEVIDSTAWRQIGSTTSKSNGRESVNRKEFLAATLGAGLGVAALTGNIGNNDGEGGALVDLAGPILHYRRIEQDVAAKDLVQPVASHLELSRHVVQTRGYPVDGLALLAEVAGLSAWLAMDSGDHGTARLRYAEAVRYSEATGSPLLTSYMTASLAQFAAESGASVQGLQNLDKARQLLDSSAPPSALAWMESLYAITYARLGDEAAMRSALRQAQRLASSDEAPVWPWVFPFTEAKASRYESIALARVGDVHSAKLAYADALPAMTAPKTRALALLEQGRMFIGAGQTEEGCAASLEALRIGQACGSERVIGGVLSLRAALPRRSVETGPLDDALESLYRIERVNSNG